MTIYSLQKTSLLSMLPMCVAAVLMLLCFSNWASASNENNDITEAFKEAYASYEAFAEKNEFRQALPAAKNALELGEELFGEDHENVAALTYNYGSNLLEVRDDQAKNVLKLAVKRYEKVYGKDSPELIPPLMDLGNAAARPNDSSGQQKYFNRALKLAEREYGKDSIRYAKLSIKAGIGILDRSQTRDAEKYLQSGYEVLSLEEGETSQDLGLAAFYLGKLQLASKNYSVSEGYFITALSVFQADEGKGTHPAELLAHAFLVQVYEELDKSDLATEHCLAIGRMTPYGSQQDYLPLYKSVIFPVRAQRQGKEGQVLIEFTVDASGFVREPRVIDLKGFDYFGQAALDSVVQWRYAPRFVDGKPTVTENVKHIVTFKLSD
jgi:TonB family protein